MVQGGEALPILAPKISCIVYIFIPLNNNKNCPDINGAFLMLKWLYEKKKKKKKTAFVYICCIAVCSTWIRYFFIYNCSKQ